MKNAQAKLKAQQQQQQQQQDVSLKFDLTTKKTRTSIIAHNFFQIIANNFHFSRFHIAI